MYADYENYTALYGSDRATEQEFSRLAWEASVFMDDSTKGVDGVKKLKAHFPDDEDDAERILRCCCELADTMWQIEQLTATATKAASMIQEENGTIHSSVVSSVSAGSESMSFATGANAQAQTATGAAVNDLSARTKLYKAIVQKYLSGASDKNGVNLLYMGPYPQIRSCCIWS